ncbi:putative MFS-type transporter [Frankliniella fusca]|uniref:MFS-type transporter n=1 Tax=Frankliniella fusca TaxID=407009 RepID=A0AAE1LKS8_9NEOP|nr:putative MFS-type transporter [Frankliniella fusca]
MNSPSVVSAPDGTEEVRVYRRRWVILALFSLVLMLNSMPWTQYTVLEDVVTNYYGVTSNLVEWTGLVYNVTAMILVPTCCLGFGKICKWWVGVRLTVSIGILGTTLGLLIRIVGCWPQHYWAVIAGQAIVGASTNFLTSAPTPSGGVVVSGKGGVFGYGCYDGWPDGSSLGNWRARHAFNISWNDSHFPFWITTGPDEEVQASIMPLKEQLDHDGEVSVISYFGCFASFALYSAAIGATSMAVLYMSVGIMGTFLASCFVPAYEWAIELTYPEPEGNPTSLLNWIVQPCSLVTTLVYSYVFSSWGAHAAHGLLGALSLVGLFMQICIPKNYKRLEAELANSRICLFSENTADCLSSGIHSRTEKENSGVKTN